MKRLFALIFTVLAVLLMNVPFAGTAEAARVAVVPIQINDALVERAADFNGYYWDIMIDKFKYPEYELMDDEKVAAVIPEEGLKSFDEATLKDVCEKCDAAAYGISRRLMFVPPHAPASIRATLRPAPAATLAAVPPAAPLPITAKS